MGSKSRSSGIMFIGDCLRPRLQSPHLGFSRPQKSGPGTIRYRYWFFLLIRFVSLMVVGKVFRLEQFLSCLVKVMRMVYTDWTGVQLLLIRRHFRATGTY